ncbi:hypothetical protein V2G26_000520 [Clonostachys chloroleuca]
MAGDSSKGHGNLHQSKSVTRIPRIPIRLDEPQHAGFGVHREPAGRGRLMHGHVDQANDVPRVARFSCAGEGDGRVPVESRGISRTGETAGSWCNRVISRIQTFAFACGWKMVLGIPD